jgi:mannosyltransferase
MRRVHATLLALILLFAAVVRIATLSKLSLWYDECASLQIAQTPWPELIHTIKLTENTPPGYYLILKIWCEVFGTSEWALRMPSAIAGVLSIWFLYRLCSYCIGKREALIAAALMAASHYHIWYSQEARAYIFVLLFAVWSCDEFVRMLDEPPRWQRDLRYWIATVLLLYSHLYAPLALAAQYLHFIVRFLSRQKPKLSVARFLQLQLSVWIVFAIWLPVVVHWYKMRSEGFWIPPAHLRDIAIAFSMYVCNGHAQILWAALALAVAGGARRDVRRVLALLGGMLILPVVLPVIASMLTHPLFVPRYGIVALAPLFILIACGIARFGRVVAPIVVVALAIPMLLAPDPMDKGPFRAVGQYLREWMQPGDYVWVNQKADLAPIRYYIGRPDVKYRAFWGKLIPLGVPLPDPKVHVWYVVSNPIPEQSGVLTINYGHWRVASQKSFDYVSIFELADGATTAEETYPESIRFSAKPPTHDRTEPATEPLHK